MPEAACDRHASSTSQAMPFGTGWQGVYNLLPFLVRWLKCDEEKSKQTRYLRQKACCFPCGPRAPTAGIERLCSPVRELRQLGRSR